MRQVLRTIGMGEIPIQEGGTTVQRQRSIQSVLLVAVIGVLSIVLVFPPVGAAPAPISFAVFGAFTGLHGGFGQELLEGARTAQKEINDAGGILGRPLNLYVADSQSDAADAVSALHQLLSIHHITAIIGPGSTELFAIKPIVDRSRIPTFFLGGTTTFDTNTDKWIWRPSPSDSQLSVAMAIYAIKKGYKTAGMMFYTDASSQTLKVPVIKTFEKLGGKVVADVQLTAGQTSYRSEVETLTKAHPGVIFTQTDAATAAVLFANFKQLNNLTIPFVGTDVTAGSNYIKSITPAVAHETLVSLVGSSPPGGAADTFIEFYRQLFDHQPLANSNYAYDATIVLALAIQQAGTVDTEKIVETVPVVSNPPGLVVTDYQRGLAALKAGRKTNYEGASGPMDWNKYHNVYGPFDAVQVGTDGKLHVVMSISAGDLQKAAP